MPCIGPGRWLTPRESRKLCGRQNMNKHVEVPRALKNGVRRIRGASNSAQYLINSPAATPGTTDAGLDTSLDPTSFHGRGIETLVFDVLTDVTDWFAIADPAEVPTIVMGFWRGQREPELFVADNPLVGSAFASDKIVSKI